MGKGEVIFIILSIANKNLVVCDIVEKCIHQNMNVLILVEDVQEAKKYDQLLWTWKQASFIPHIYIETDHIANQIRRHPPYCFADLLGFNPPIHHNGDIPCGYRETTRRCVLSNRQNVLLNFTQI